MNDIKNLIEFVEGLNIDPEDKAFLIEKLNDPVTTTEEKSKIISDFLKSKEEELDAAEAEIINPIISDTERELEDAEKEYDSTIQSLTEEAQKLQEEISRDLDSAE